jgi:hypothetical protein
MNDAKRFLLVSWDGGGNLGPELSIARRLIARGHTVRLLGDPTLAGEARASGCAFSAWRTAPHKQAPGRENDIFKDYELGGPLQLIDTYMREFLAEPAPPWVADTLQELECRPVDAVLVDFALPAALIAAQRLKLPTATLMPNIWVIPTRGIPPMGPGFLPAKSFVGRARDAIVRSMTERVFQRALPALNATRQAHGLAPVSDVYQQFLAADQILVQTSPAFDFTSPHLPSNVRYVGPELDDPAWSIGAAARWQSPFAADDRRRVRGIQSDLGGRRFAQATQSGIMRNSARPRGRARACREDEPQALPVRDFQFRLVRHHRQLAAFSDRVAKAPHESEIDVATLPAWLQVELAHEEQIASSARRKLIPEPVLLEEHLVEGLELATICVQHLVERLAQIGGLAHVDARDARVPNHDAFGVLSGHDANVEPGDQSLVDIWLPQGQFCFDDHAQHARRSRHRASLSTLKGADAVYGNRSGAAGKAKDHRVMQRNTCRASHWMLLWQVGDLSATLYRTKYGLAFESEH